MRIVVSSLFFTHWLFVCRGDLRYRLQKCKKTFNFSGSFGKFENYRSSPVRVIVNVNFETPTLDTHKKN